MTQAETKAQATRDTPSRFFNRELSQLAFQRRVLSLAHDPEIPLLERAKFLAISSQILDEFFQVRVAGLKQQLDAGLGAVSPDAKRPKDQLRRIREEVLDLVAHQAQLFRKELLPQLAGEGIQLVEYDSLAAEEVSELGRIFEQRIFPVLTPLSVDPAHPFPYISNLSFNLAVVLFDPTSGEHRFARLKVPPVLPRFLSLDDGKRFVPIEQLIAAHLPQLFPGMDLVSCYPFRVTRDAELAVEEEEAEDLLLAIESSLHRRRRMNDVVRLEIDHTMSEQVKRLLVRELDIEADDVYVSDAPLDLGGLWTLHGVDRPDLKDLPWQRVTPPGLLDEEDGVRDVFEALDEGDVLVHHPYEAFGASVGNFLSQASRDPNVLAIKNTVYRTSGEQNQIVRALIRAAQAGKEVVALIELKARFDEEANIEWARALEQAGVHVVFGLVGLKTHAKATLVVRQEADGIRRYCHVGTGNYHPDTAKIYEDVGLLTANADVAADLTRLFNYLTGFARPQEYAKIVVAPADMRSSVLEMISEEARHVDGRVVMKLNNLSDPRLIDALYDASSAGVQVDLVVRGICCLRPGVPGLSENIRVRSILGRFLEHSRLFCFGSETRGVRYLLGSADMMTRNLDRRVEILSPIEGSAQRERIAEILSIDLADDVQRWELQADGGWTRHPSDGGDSSQERLHLRALERGHENRSEKSR